MTSEYLTDLNNKWAALDNKPFVAWEQYLEYIADKQHDQIENMSMLIRRLVFVARHAGTQSKVPDQALDYLKRQGLINDTGFLRQDGD